MKLTWVQLTKDGSSARATDGQAFTYAAGKVNKPSIEKAAADFHTEVKACMSEPKASGVFHP